MRPVTGAVSLGLRAERGARRELGRRAEDAALATLDALLASREEVRTQHALYLREAERARR